MTNTTEPKICNACSGTGRFQGRFSDENWPDCPICDGSGVIEYRESPETRLVRRISQLIEVSNKQTEIIEFAREIATDAIAHAAGATSAYKQYAGNSERRSVRDALYKTRLNDFEKAVERNRASLLKLIEMIAELNHKEEANAESSA